MVGILCIDRKGILLCLYIIYPSLHQFLFYHVMFVIFRMILCNSLETLSQYIHGLLSLIYPFRWQHIFVPVLPEALINYLAAVPFIIGIKSYLAHSKTEFEISEVF